MINEANNFNSAYVMRHMTRKAWSQFWLQACAEKRHRDELDLLATTSQCPEPEKALINPCPLCPHFKGRAAAATDDSPS